MFNFVSCAVCKSVDSLWKRLNQSPLAATRAHFLLWVLLESLRHLTEAMRSLPKTSQEKPTPASKLPFQSPNRRLCLASSLTLSLGQLCAAPRDSIGAMMSQTVSLQVCPCHHQFLSCRRVTGNLSACAIHISHKHKYVAACC